MSIQTFQAEFTYTNNTIDETTEALMFAVSLVHTHFSAANNILPPLNKYSICKKAKKYSIDSYVDFYDNKGRLNRMFFSILVYKKGNKWHCLDLKFHQTFNHNL